MTIENYLSRPQLKQKTKEWEEWRAKNITATDCNTILELDPHKTKYDLYHSKMNKNAETLDLSTATVAVAAAVAAVAATATTVAATTAVAAVAATATTVAATTAVAVTTTVAAVATVATVETATTDALEWGNLFEDVARKLSEERYNLAVAQVGLTWHTQYTWLGASPDGLVTITQDSALDKLLKAGNELYRVNKTKCSINPHKVAIVEYKCPISRKITKTVPIAYWVQMQILMEVWDIDVCLYSEHSFSKFIDETDFNDNNTIKYICKGSLEHVDTGETTWWRLNEYWDYPIMRDRKWFSNVLPVLQDFWHSISNPTSIPKTIVPSNANASIILAKTNVKRRKFETNMITTDNIGNPFDYRTLNPSSFVHPASVNAWFLEDPLLDWLNVHGIKVGLPKDHEINGFIKYIAEQGTKFKQTVISWLKNTHQNITQIDMDDNPSSLTNQTVQLIKHKVQFTVDGLNRTRDAIGGSVPIIFNAYIADPDLNICGQIDMLVHKNYVDKLFPGLIQSQNNDATQSKITNTSKKGTKRKAPIDPEHTPSTYYPFIIKYSSLNMAADGVHLINNPKQKVYKATSIFLYKALSYMLSQSQQSTQYQPCGKSFVIGRKTSYVRKGETYASDNFLQSIATIDWETRDSEYNNDFTDALAWINKVNEDGTSWNKWITDAYHPELTDATTVASVAIAGVLPVSASESVPAPVSASESVPAPVSASESAPAPTMELYPNMKNDRDYPWHAVKSQMAKNIGELTDIWYLGTKKRKEIWNKGCHSWFNLTPKLIEETHLTNETIVSNMIKANKSHVPINLDRLKVPLTGKELVEFYVDFESVTDLNDDFKQFPKISGTSMIYMIGCMVKDRVHNEEYFLNYVVDRLTLECETKMINDWLQDLVRIQKAAFHDANGRTNPSKRPKSEYDILESTHSQSEYHDAKQINIVHWSRAEYGLLTKALSNATKKTKTNPFIDYEYRLIDLYECFKTAEIGLPGAFSYNLKTVAKSLRSINLITSSWDAGMDGNTAMVSAWIADREASVTSVNMGDMPRLDEVIKYNQIDCEVMAEIIEKLIHNKIDYRKMV
jgi:hypothetical protein